MNEELEVLNLINEAFNAEGKEKVLSLHRVQSKVIMFLIKRGVVTFSTSPKNVPELIQFLESATLGSMFPSLVDEDNKDARVLAENINYLSDDFKALVEKNKTA